MFQSSDLACAKRREFLGAAREGGALLRDTDGFALTMVPLAQLEAITEIAQVAVAALLALAALSRGSTRPADFGQLAWLATFDEDDRAEFFEELRDALSVAAATRDAAPVETCLREWRTTARALSDPLRRAVLTAPGTMTMPRSTGRRSDPALGAYRPHVPPAAPAAGHRSSQSSGFLCTGSSSGSGMSCPAAQAWRTRSSSGITWP